MPWTLGAAHLTGDEENILTALEGRELLYSEAEKSGPSIASEWKAVSESLVQFFYGQRFFV
jgi:hypothetical protein